MSPNTFTENENENVEVINNLDVTPINSILYKKLFDIKNGYINENNLKFNETFDNNKLAFILTNFRTNKNTRQCKKFTNCR